MRRRKLDLPARINSPLAVTADKAYDSEKVCHQIRDEGFGGYGFMNKGGGWVQPPPRLRCTSGVGSGIKAR